MRPIIDLMENYWHGSRDIFANSGGFPAMVHYNLMSCCPLALPLNGFPQFQKYIIQYAFWSHQLQSIILATCIFGFAVESADWPGLKVLAKTVKACWWHWDILSDFSDLRDIQKIINSYCIRNFMRFKEHKRKEEIENKIDIKFVIT